MPFLRLRVLLPLLCCVFALCAQQTVRPPAVRSWTIREIGTYKKIPTATLRAKMAQKGVVFGVNEPYDQRKVEATIVLLRDLYKEAGIVVTVVSSKAPAGASAVKVEYTVHKQ